MQDDNRPTTLEYEGPPRPGERLFAHIARLIEPAADALTPAGLFFLAAALVAMALYATAMLTLPRPGGEGEVVIRWATDAAPARPTQVARFEENYPGVRVIVDPGLGADQTKLVVQCATGVGPDVIDIYNVRSMHSLVEAGILLDLTDYARAMGFGPDKTYPALREGLMVEGRQYRYPCNVWANVIVYNREIFDDHGIAYPSDDWTWDQFIEVGLKLRDRSTSRTGRSHIPLASYARINMFGDVLFSFGGEFFTDHGLRSALDSPAALAAWQFYGELFTRHRIIPTQAEADALSTQGGWGLSPLRWFSEERAAMIPIGRWYIILGRAYTGLLPKLGAVRLPHVPGRGSTGAIDARASGINAKAPPERREAALKFLQYLASEPYNRLIIEDGDSLPPNPEMARTGEDLVNKAITDPTWHQTFIDAARDARPIDTSAFLDGSLLERWMTEALERVENGSLTPEQGARRIANEVNQTIRTNLKRRPDLQRKYEQLTGRAYENDWWRGRVPPER